MPFEPILNTVEVKFFAQRNNQLRMNVIHFNYDGAPRPNAGTLATMLEDCIAGILIPQATITTNATRWYYHSARDIHDANGAEVFSSTQIQGIIANQAFPGNVSFALTKRTGVVGRSHRGRYYLFDMAEDFFNGDDLNIIELPNLAVLAASLLAKRGGGTFVPAVGSKKLGLSTLINAITFDGIADSQRRRLSGRGA